MRNFLIALCLFLLAACASASNPGAMVAQVSESTIVADTSALRENITLGDVGGGRETNPLWTSQVSSEDFAEALRQSFAAHALLATEGGDYRLDATLVELKQPFAGFNLTVTSIVDYALTKVDTGEVVFEDRIENAYTAKAGDSFLAAKRLQLANEGSIRGNIESLIEKVIVAVDDSVELDAEASAENRPNSGDQGANLGT